MRAFAVRSFGEAPEILDLPVPTDDGGILIRVTYAGVNPVDYKLLDRLGGGKTFPFVLGADFAGVVEEVPEGETKLHAGDRVFGIARNHGAYAEYTSVTPDKQTEPFAQIPDGITDEQASALPIAALTALASLDRLQTGPNQILVVMGATGALGGYAVQMAHSRGAHVIATVHGDVDEARSLGADEVYDAKIVDVPNAVRADHPDGVDAVLDLVSDGEAIVRDTLMLKPGGSLVSTIHVADIDWFADHKITAYNVGLNEEPASSPNGLLQVAHMLAEGAITARVRSIYDLEDASTALAGVRHGGIHGKVIIRL